MRRLLVAGLLVNALVACGGKEDPGSGLPKCASPVNGTNITTRKVGSVVGGAMLATAPPGDPRLFVIEQRGAIRIFSGEQLLPDPFLDLSVDASGPVLAGGEQGLLGLAFHPKYASTGLFYVFYTTNKGGMGLRDVVARCKVGADANKADPKTCVEILSIPDFAGNHNGGMIEFGPKDALLYIGTGDGGGGGDPQRTAQNKDSLLGKILRIDVDGTAAGKMYGIPSDNPFASGGGAPEVFMLGLRNPWRFSFDRETGDLWIGDVGQGQIEELTVLRPAQQKGANLGWSIYEGKGCCETQADGCSGAPRTPCAPDGMVFPQDERTHADGWISIIAGQTYRGTCYPDIVGWHFYTDYGKGQLVKARLASDDTLEIVNLGQLPSGPASLHEDARGELFLTTTGGDVYHLEAGP